MSDLYVIKVPVLSTAHLKPNTYYKLEAAICEGNHAGAAQRYWNDVETLWVYVAEGVDLFGDSPADLETVFNWARGQGYDYIRFDGEIGAIVPELPDFSKEWP